MDVALRAQGCDTPVGEVFTRLVAVQSVVDLWAVGLLAGSGTGIHRSDLGSIDNDELDVLLCHGDGVPLFHATLRMWIQGPIDQFVAKALTVRLNKSYSVT